MLNFAALEGKNVRRENNQGEVNLINAPLKEKEMRAITPKVSWQKPRMQSDTFPHSSESF